MGTKQKIVLKIKEEYYDLVPRPTKEERKLLKQDIMLNGQHDPIVINRNGFVLDGHTRYEICEELGIECKYRIQDFNTKEDEKRYVINCNVNRRHLNAFQRVELMYHVYLIEKEKARKRYYHGEEYGKKLGSASAIVGNQIGLNRNTVSRAVYIMEHGKKSLVEKVRNGKIGIDKAYWITNPRIKIVTKRYINNETKLICPKCQQVSKKKEWKIA